MPLRVPSVCSLPLLFSLPPFSFPSLFPSYLPSFLSFKEQGLERTTTACLERVCTQVLHAGVVSGPRECGFAELPDHTTCLSLHGPLCCGGLRASVSCTSRLGEETSAVGVALVPAIEVLLRCSGLQSLPLLLHPKSLPSPQMALGTLWMEVSEDTCLVWGFIPRAWHKHASVNVDCYIKILNQTVYRQHVL